MNIGKGNTLKLAIIGRGELAIELYNLIFSCYKRNEYTDIFFVDTEENIANNTIAEMDYFKTDRDESEIMIAIGEPSMRQKIYEKYTKEGFRTTTFIHPLSFLSANTVIGSGTLVFPFTYIAQNTRIGCNVLFHTGSIIENDCVIGNNCFVSSNAFVGAKTNIGDTCFLGPNSSVRDSLNVGHNSIIGMGSVVTKSVNDNTVCYGNPAKTIRDNKSHKVFK